MANYTLLRIFFLTKENHRKKPRGAGLFEKPDEPVLVANSSGYFYSNT
jgi:hypothetical protein